MAVGKIIQIDDMISLTLPKSLLEQLGLMVGDEVNVDIVDNRIVAQSKAQTDHEERLSKIAQGLIERRSEVYKALAGGVDQPDV